MLILRLSIICSSSAKKRTRTDSDGEKNQNWIPWHCVKYLTEPEEVTEGEEELSDPNIGSSDEESDDNQSEKSASSIAAAKFRLFYVAEFYVEILESIQKGVEDKVDVDTIRLEINSSK